MTNNGLTEQKNTALLVQHFLFCNKLELNHTIILNLCSVCVRVFFYYKDRIH